MNPADTDADGLLDGWEVLGYDPAGGESIALSWFGASPRHQGAFVEIDWNPGNPPSPSAFVEVAILYADVGGPGLNPVEPFATPRAWTLAGGTGTKTVRVWFRDAWGNTSAPVEDTIALDVTPPTNGKLVAAAASQSVSLSWSGVTDLGTSVASYTVVFGTTAAPPSCSAGTPLYSGPATAVTHTGLAAGATRYYRLCATDAVGNVSFGAIAKATALP